MKKSKGFCPFPVKEKGFYRHNECASTKKNLVFAFASKQLSLLGPVLIGLAEGKNFLSSQGLSLQKSEHSGFPYVFSGSIPMVKTGLVPIDRQTALPFNLSRRGG